MLYAKLEVLSNSPHRSPRHSNLPPLDLSQLAICYCSGCGGGGFFFFFFFAVILFIYLSFCVYGLWWVVVIATGVG